MTTREYLLELAYPARSLGMMVSMVVFYLLATLASSAGLLGIWLAVMVVPALFRYLVMVAEARARGRDAEPPGIEFFSLAGNLWTLFPAIPAILVALGWTWFAASFGPVGAALFVLFATAVVPAMMSVLVITHSPAQSLNPLAIATLIRESGPSYWYAPFTLMLVFVLPGFLAWLPTLVTSLLQFYLLFAFYAICGAITREKNLIDEVDIADPLERDPEKVVADLQRERTMALNHGYALVSRGNRDGGLSHIHAWLQKDPDPDDGWAWFYNGMMNWENNEAALYFAQDYVARLLAAGDFVKANKLIMRCRLVNERFRPRQEDLPLAIDSAERCGNHELAEALKRL